MSGVNKCNKVSDEPVDAPDLVGSYVENTSKYLTYVYACLREGNVVLQYSKIDILPTVLGSCYMLHATCYILL